MPLIPCPACGKSVSQQAPTCPQCGHPIAATPHEKPPQTVYVQQPKSGGSGCVLFLFLALIGGGIATATKPDEAAMKRAIVAKYGVGFGVGAAIGEAIGTAKYTYHDYLIFSTMTAEGIGGARRTIATGYFGHVNVTGP